VFGTAALMLAAVGLYGVMAAYVRQRDTEIGIRFALGATPADIRGLEVSEALRLVGTGAVTGLAAAVAVTRGSYCSVEDSLSASRANLGIRAVHNASGFRYGKRIDSLKPG